MPTNQINCQNCEQLIEEDFKFCSNCGQKTNEELTIGVLFYNTISNYFSFDARFLKSFLPLMFRPGYLARRFLEGKRLLYLHPAQLYLFVSVIFFFFSSFVVDEWKKEADKINKKIAESAVVTEASEASKETLDSIQRAVVVTNLEKNKELLGLNEADIKQADSIISAPKKNDLNVDWGFNKSKIDSLISTGADDQKIYNAMGMSDNPGFFERRAYTTMLKLSKGSGASNIIQRAYDAIPIALFILLPLFALILKIFYYKRGRYSHHLVFSFYFFSFLFTLFGILLGINQFVNKDIPGWINWLIVLSTFFYFYLALLNFYRRNWFFTLIKSSIITSVFLLLVIPTALGILIGFGFLNA